MLPSMDLESMQNGDSKGGVEEAGKAAPNSSTGEASKRCCSNPWWNKSYLLDYCGILLGGCLILLIRNEDAEEDMFKLQTAKQVLSLDDPAIGRPIHFQTIPIEDVNLLFLIPTIFLYFVTTVTRPNGIEDVHSVICALLSGLIISNFVTFLIREHIQKPRPDLLVRCAPLCMQNFTWACAPDESLYNGICRNGCCPVQCNQRDDRYPAVVECSYDFGNEINSDLTLEQRCNRLWGFVIDINQAQCQGPLGGLDGMGWGDGFTAFPSGHIGNIWGAYLFNWVYLAGKFGLFTRGNTHRNFFPGLFLMSMFPITATYVGISRVVDNRHDITDVVIGALIFSIPVLLTYHMYFESIFTGGMPITRTPDVPVLDILLCRRKKQNKDD